MSGGAIYKGNILKILCWQYFSVANQLGKGYIKLTFTDMSENQQLLLKSGGYRNLKSFQLAQLCFDITVRFVELYIPKNSRTVDQMVQAARSGVEYCRRFGRGGNQQTHWIKADQCCKSIVGRAAPWLWRLSAPARRNNLEQRTSLDTRVYQSAYQFNGRVQNFCAKLKTASIIVRRSQFLSVTVRHRRQWGIAFARSDLFASCPPTCTDRGWLWKRRRFFWADAQTSHW